MLGRLEGSGVGVEGFSVLHIGRCMERVRQREAILCLDFRRKGAERACQTKGPTNIFEAEIRDEKDGPNDCRDDGGRGHVSDGRTRDETAPACLAR